MQNNLKYKDHYYTKLPHIQPKDSIIFITFRLDIPCTKEYFLILKRRKLELSNFNQNVPNANEQSIVMNKKLFAFQDSFFDTYKHQNNFFQNDNCAKIMETEIHLHDKSLYELFAFTIMPNHVHMLFKPLKDESGEFISISRIMNRLKGRSARSINLYLERNGRLWQNEYYDHYVRNEIEMNNIIHYIIMNPVKAGLVDQPKHWQWNWVMQEFRCFLEEDYVREDYSNSFEFEDCPF